VSLHPQKLLQRAALQQLAAPAHALAIVALRRNLYVCVGTRTGLLIRSALDPTSGALGDTRSRFLGLRPVRLAVLKVPDGDALLALGERAWLTFAAGPSGLLTAPLACPPLQWASSFASAADPFGWTALQGDTLKVCFCFFSPMSSHLFQVLSVRPTAEPFHVHALPLRATPRRLVLHVSTGLIVAACSAAAPLVAPSDPPSLELLSSPEVRNFSFFSPFAYLLPGGGGEWSGIAAFGGSVWSGRGGLSCSLCRSAWRRHYLACMCGLFRSGRDAGGGTAHARGTRTTGAAVDYSHADGRGDAGAGARDGAGRGPHGAGRLPGTAAVRRGPRRAPVRRGQEALFEKVRKQGLPAAGGELQRAWDALLGGRLGAVGAVVLLRGGPQRHSHLCRRDGPALLHVHGAPRLQHRYACVSFSLSSFNRVQLRWGTSLGPFRFCGCPRRSTRGCGWTRAARRCGNPRSTARPGRPKRSCASASRRCPSRCTRPPSWGPPPRWTPPCSTPPCTAAWARSCPSPPAKRSTSSPSSRPTCASRSA
jgi:hypothetical protein